MEESDIDFRDEVEILIDEIEDKFESLLKGVDKLSPKLRESFGLIQELFGNIVEGPPCEENLLLIKKLIESLC